MSDSGSTGTPFHMTAKCRCGPVVIPVRPMKPITVGLHGLPHLHGRKREGVVKMRVLREVAARMRDERDHRAVREVPDERDYAVARRGHRSPERRGDIDRGMEMRVRHASVGGRRLELERRRAEGLCDHATDGQRPCARVTGADHRRGDELRERGLRVGDVLRESGQDRDLRRLRIRVAGRGRGGERLRSIAQSREQRLPRSDGSLQRGEEGCAIRQFHLRGQQSALEREQLVEGFALRVAEVRWHRRGRQGREEQRLAIAGVVRNDAVKATARSGGARKGVPASLTGKTARRASGSGHQSPQRAGEGRPT